MISRPQRLRLVRAVLAGDPDPPVWRPRVQGVQGSLTHWPTTECFKVLGLEWRDHHVHVRSRTNGNEQFYADE